MPGSLLDELRQQALLGTPEAVAVLHDAMREQGELPRRYLDGQTAQVWEELVALGPGVRDPVWADQAWSIAWETMRRVRRNVEILLQRYEEIGYQLDSRTPLGQPAPAEQLDELEEQAQGPIPLSMRAFWTVVGSLDLQQSPEQIVPDWLREAPSDLERLGGDDPLCVYAADQVLWDDPKEEARRLYGIVGDVSPEPGGQFFVQALRRSLQGGGFRGRLDLHTCDRWLPWRELHQRLGAGLLPT
jgi:hypothetical protein